MGRDDLCYKITSLAKFSQHTGVGLPGDTQQNPKISPSKTYSSVERAFSFRPLPERNSVLMLHEEDLPSIAAAAILCMHGNKSDGCKKNVRILAHVCKERLKPWEKKKFPTEEKMWQDERMRVIDPVRIFAEDRSIPIKSRVAAVIRWIRFGMYPPKCEVFSLTRRKELVELVRDNERGGLSYEVHEGVAVVCGAHQDALEIGYCLAPVVVLNNYFKVSINAWDERYFNFDQALKGIGGKQNGWEKSRKSLRGHLGIVTMKQAIAVAAKYALPKENFPK